MKRFLNKTDISYQLSNLRQIVFEVTDACNLKCKYCGYGEFYSDYDKRENKNLSIEDAIALLDYLTQFWQSEQNVSFNKNVYITFYGGEPLLNMNFIKQVIKYLEENPCSVRHFVYSMTTNAVLLDRYMDYLVEKNFTLLISLDGNAQNTAYRVDALGNPSFEKIVRNVEFLRDAYPDYFNKEVNFNAVLHNKNSVESIHRFFQDRYQKTASIAELSYMGIRPDKQKEFMQTYRNADESLRQSEHYEEIEKERFIRSPNYQTVCKFLHQYSGFVYRNYNKLLFEKHQKSNWITGTCKPFNKKMFVTVNGKILPCERIGHQFALGRVDKNGVHLDFEEIVQRYSHYFAKLENQCKTCYRTEACIQCIFNLHDLEKDPVCNGFMNKNDFEQYHEQMLSFLRNHPEDYYRMMEEVIIV
ncbi:MAG: radical SAM peptide maturase [Bacteroidetes bacterium]|nr:radical SAM peptide maturase [Bacteroidota bacterium]MCL2302407.1 radical SAM peptide maturase [Lentimicrobiaceae bacterium]